MQKIQTYIVEKLKINKNTKSIYHTYCPQNERQLKDLLNQLISERGVDADLNDIDVSKVTDMSSLFNSSYLHTIRNIDISEWDVSNVTNMNEMFSDCEDFNCDLSDWDVSNVEKMNYMFYNCKSFDCDLSSWDVSKVKRWNNVFGGTNLDVNGSKEYKRPNFNWNNVI